MRLPDFTDGARALARFNTRYVLDDEAA